jgi:hypothetical protein
MSIGQHDNHREIRYCYECLSMDVEAPREVVGQGLCREHLALEYAEEAYYDMLATEQEAAADDEYDDIEDYDYMSEDNQ